MHLPWPRKSSRPADKPNNPEQWSALYERESVSAVEKGASGEWIEPLLTLSAPGMTLAELGCGPGTVSVELALHGRKVILLDFSHGVLRTTQRLLEATGVQGQLLTADLLKGLPFADRSVDIAWNAGVLEHFDDDGIRDALSEMVRMSRKAVVAMVPNGGSLPYRLGKWLQERAGTWPWGHERSLRTLRPLFPATVQDRVEEWAIDFRRSAPFFLPRPFRAAVEQWYDSLDGEDQAAITRREGYLLVSACRLD